MNVLESNFIPFEKFVRQFLYCVVKREGVLDPRLINQIGKTRMIHPHNFKTKGFLTLSVKILCFKQDEAVVRTRPGEVEKFTIKEKRDPLWENMCPIYTSSNDFSHQNVR